MLHVEQESRQFNCIVDRSSAYPPYVSLGLEATLEYRDDEERHKNWDFYSKVKRWSRSVIST